MNGCVLFFVRNPVPGKVKTRLAADTSDRTACDLYRLMASSVLQRLEEDGVETAVCYTPEDARPQVVDWLGPGRAYISQKGPDLGRRMENAFREIFFMGYRKAVLVGSDIPGITSEDCLSALEALSPKRAVLGPAGDGGYYMIGFHRDGFVPQAFSGMKWGGHNVFGSTYETIQRGGLSVSLKPRHMDVDTLNDLREFIKSADSAAWKGTPFMERARTITGS
ncbi:TIGR04282 family arsenosugar biosynthesis glycosyltransferase [Desulfovibrio oxyclinae]|jgi:hypothetical protein|uniref:TIGR04282 family arsenosugar biosynthesis glycosyltransferase n=1 Tax=Desulfovibrio oxyclinae TaxID=63560 RepID=UPI000374F8EC|nr:TIGR04282 family arsenosugar biosynthesis glycosyltransferase [Desulfovibrio oxyclinae]